MAAISSVMTPDPAVCTPDTPIREVAQMMSRNDCGEIPVVESDRNAMPVGVVTDRDIAVRIVAEGRDLGSARASDAMTSPVTTVREDTSINDACAVMEREQIRRVVVVDRSGKVSGIVAQADIARSGRDEETAELVREVSEPTHAHH